MDFIAHLNAAAFADVDALTDSVDWHGWIDPQFGQVFVRCLGAQKDVTIIEVGTWKGVSAITMASTCKQLGVRARIVCVDTWLGAPEFWTWGLEDPTRGQSLRRHHGYPQVYYTFLQNVKARGCTDTISPLPLSSMQAAEVLQHYNVHADIIYVDAAHEYDAVIADIRRYWQLLRPGGTMMGDDYMDNWPGVKRATDEFAAEIGVPLQVSGVMWILTKP